MQQPRPTTRIPRAIRHQALADAIARNAQHVWSERYIGDNAIVRRVNEDADGDYTDSGSNTHYYLTDAQFSVTALVDDGAGIIERVRYIPYGVARHHQAADADGDGDADGADDLGLSKTIDQAGYVVEFDFNRDGANNGKDAKFASSNQQIAQIAGRISVVDSPIGYDGYLFNEGDKNYTVRNRTYLPDSGRWLERDPLGTALRQMFTIEAHIAAGPNRYQYALGNPTGFSDPSGLIEDPRRCMWIDGNECGLPGTGIFVPRPGGGQTCNDYQPLNPLDVVLLPGAPDTVFVPREFPFRFRFELEVCTGSAIDTEISPWTVSQNSGDIDDVSVTAETGRTTFVEVMYNRFGPKGDRDAAVTFNGLEVPAGTVYPASHEFVYNLVGSVKVNPSVLNTPIH